MRLYYNTGHKYKSPQGDIYVLKATNDLGNAFKFVCGHWCTDCVFMNYVCINTGLSTKSKGQLSLF